MVKDDVLFTGKKVSQVFADYYNRISIEIDNEKEGEFKENLKNTRHKMLVIYANDKE